MHPFLSKCWFSESIYSEINHHQNQHRPDILHANGVTAVLHILSSPLASSLTFASFLLPSSTFSTYTTSLIVIMLTELQANGPQEPSGVVPGTIGLVSQCNNRCHFMVVPASSQQWGYFWHYDHPSVAHCNSVQKPTREEFFFERSIGLISSAPCLSLTHSLVSKIRFSHSVQYRGGAQWRHTESFCLWLQSEYFRCALK